MVKIMVKIDLSEWITQADAARRIGLTPANMQVYAKRHEWRSVKLGHTRLYRVADVEAERERRERRARAHNGTSAS